MVIFIDLVLILINKDKKSTCQGPSEVHSPSLCKNIIEKTTNLLTT